MRYRRTTQLTPLLLIGLGAILVAQYGDMIGLSAKAQGQQSLPSEPSLSTHARLITSTTRWILPFYVWLNKNTLLAFEGTTPRYAYEINWDYQVMYFQDRAADTTLLKPLAHAIKVNAMTGHTQPFAALNMRWTDPASIVSPRRHRTVNGWCLESGARGASTHPPGCRSVWMGDPGWRWLTTVISITFPCLSASRYGHATVVNGLPSMPWTHTCNATCSPWPLSIRHAM